MRKLCHRAIVCFSVCAWFISYAADKNRIDDLAGEIARLNGSVNDPDLRGTGAETARALLRFRLSLVSELAQLDPERAISLALPKDLAAVIRDRLGNGCAEENGEWQGVLTQRIADDFVHHRSEWRSYLQTEGGRFEVHFASPSSSPRQGPAIVRGIRTDDHIAATGITLAPIAPNGICNSTGPQKIAVVMVRTADRPFPPDRTPEHYQQVFFGQSGGSANTESLDSYWRDVSYDKTSATGKVFGPYIVSKMTCNDQGQAEALKMAAAELDLTKYNRLAFVFPDLSCGWGGLSTLGCETLVTAGQGSLMVSEAELPAIDWYNPQSEVRTIEHEMGHSLGLDHASSQTFNPIPLGALSDPGKLTEYGDPFSIMGGSYGHCAAPHKAFIGWLTASDIREVTSSGTFTIAPFESTTGVRALRVRRASDAWLWIEYRQPAGYDDPLRSTGIEDKSGTNVFRSALVHYEGPLLRREKTYLLDFNQPSSAPQPGWAYDWRKVGLEAGQSWSDPYSPLSLKVNSATADGLAVSVQYDQLCAALQSSVSSFPPEGGTGAISVMAPSDCSWTASSDVPWITLTGATSGRGSGSVPFLAGANASSQQRSGNITVERQSVRIQEAGAGLNLTGYSPPAGSGATGDFRFEFSSPSGFAGAKAEINLTSNPAYVSFSYCRVLFTPNERSVRLADGKTGQWLGPISSVSANNPPSLSNGSCAIFADGTDADVTSNKATLSLRVRFYGADARTYAVRVWMYSPTGQNEADAGLWTVPPPPSVPVNGIANAASYETGFVAPGEIVAVFGADMGPASLNTMSLTPENMVANSLADVQVLFDGIPSPLVYVQANQISAVVPFAIAGRNSTTVTIVYGGRASSGIVMPVLASAPAIFTQSATGTGPGSILNEDLSVNSASNPAARGSIAVIYATGAGATTPVSVDGQLAVAPLPKHDLPMTVSVGGIAAEIVYAGPAPGLVNGAVQVNAKIPESVVPGPAVPVLLKVGERVSQAGVTIAVK